MIELYLLMTAIVILGTLLASYNRTGDPLSPLVIFAPMLMYVYVYHPYVVNENGSLGRLFNDVRKLDFALLVSLLGVTAFCLGAGHYGRPKGADQRFVLLEQDAGPRQRRQFLMLSLLTGTVSFVAMAWQIHSTGGLVYMLSQAKPFFSKTTGYIGELPMLTFPAMLLLAVAWQGQRLTFGKLLIALYIASPQITWAIIGKRRGTIFLVAVSLASFWYLVRNKRPSWRLVITGLGVLGFVLLFISANRAKMAYTSGMDVDFSIMGRTLSGERVNPGDEFVAASATIISSDDHRAHYWGLRFFAMFVVRPIPRFIWPTKWDDLGLGWMVTSPGKNGLTSSEWVESVGFEPTKGNAPGFVADLFLEWSWGGVIACYLLGLLFSWLWRQWLKHGGVWAAIYVEAIILSIYLPTQSLGAWAYRFALLAVPTYVIFKFIKRGKRTGRARPPVTAPLAPRTAPTFDSPRAGTL